MPDSGRPYRLCLLLLILPPGLADDLAVRRGTRIRHVELRHAFLLVGIGARHNVHARHAIAGVLRQVRHVGGDIEDTGYVLDSGRPYSLCLRLLIRPPGLLDLVVRCGTDSHRLLC